MADEQFIPEGNPGFDRRGLVEFLRGHFALGWKGIHGAAHWARVRKVGLELAAAQGGDLLVVELFALLHDSCRRDDGFDRDHGPRAARLAPSLEGRFFHIGKERLALLCTAIEGHTRGGVSPDPTVQSCWDADRIDLRRLGIRPDPRFLSEAGARYCLDCGDFPGPDPEAIDLP